VSALALALACRTDASSPLLMLLSVAAPFWSLLALAALAFAAARATGLGVRLLALAGTAVALVLLAGDLGFFVRTPREPAPSPHDLRVVEFNVSRDNGRPHAAADWIAAQRPDVAILLEAADQGAAVAAQLGRTLPYRTTCRGDRRCSTVILSRVPPVERQGLAHGDADNRRALSAALARFGAPWNATIVAIHLSRPLPMGSQKREIDQLAAALAGRNDHRLLVSGDFNSPDWSIALRQVLQRLALASVPSQPSWPSDEGIPPVLTIDHSLLRGAWAGARLHRGPALGSDHRPFLLVLTPATDGTPG
jgi:endonuclease/exonuclease/phosphatase (EEP) superfamily protein YafD